MYVLRELLRQNVTGQRAALSQFVHYYYFMMLIVLKHDLELMQCKHTPATNPCSKSWGFSEPFAPRKA